MTTSQDFFKEWLKLSQHNTQMLQQWSQHFSENSKRLFDFYQDVAHLQTKYHAEISKAAKNNNIAQEFNEYLIDYTQRQILFWDVLRQRGNQYIEHNRAGNPPVLVFDYEMLTDGRTLAHPVNYALVAITPPKGIKVDNNKRPFLIVDPRAGHGAGIGGFKDDSQVGVALRAGHPVYFVIFFPEPEPNQTLRDVAYAEKKFAETVVKRHPNSPKPCIIGNCQGGWAVMVLAAIAPNLAGGLVINGAPLSYWAGENGKNPMRYTGGLTGGSWPANFASDLGNGKFDGANLVANFEKLNPANTYWGKYYNLFTHVDTEEKRFLDFERWWGGFYLLNADEIRGIVENLFIGNHLTHGKIAIDRANNLDLRKIQSPIIVFCSEGDNITPPQQALNWITDIYHDEIEIKEAKQTIVYLVHTDIGHLGIFVSARVATKEHSEIVDLLDYIEILPSGLYEMIIHENPDAEDDESKYKVILEERTINDIKDRSESSHKEDKNIFGAVQVVSKFNSMLYDLFISPSIRMLSNEKTAEILRQLHPLRRNRYLISDSNPFFKPLSLMANKVKEDRQPIKKDNTFLAMQNEFSHLMIKMLNNYQEARDDVKELTFYQIYGQLGILWSDMLQRKAKPYELNEEESEEEHTAIIAKKMLEGGPVDAVIRVLVLIIGAQKFIHGSRIGTVRDILLKGKLIKDIDKSILREKIHTQSLLAAENPELALQTLPQLIHSKTEKKAVLDALQGLLKSVPLISPKAEEMWARAEHILNRI